MINEAPWPPKKRRNKLHQERMQQWIERGSSALRLGSLCHRSLRRGEQPSGPTPWGARSRSGRRRTRVFRIFLGCLLHGEERSRSKRPAAAAAATAAANGLVRRRQRGADSPTALVGFSTCCRIFVFLALPSVQSTGATLLAFATWAIHRCSEKQI